MNAFEQTSFLQYKVKHLTELVDEFKSGERYIKMEKHHKKMKHSYESRIKTLSKELAAANTAIITNRKLWFEVNEDIQKEHRAEMKKLEAEKQKLTSRLFEAERQRDEALDDVTKWRNLYYQAASELEDEKEKNIQLVAMLNKDYENSSIPSSKAIARKKIPNSREKSGRKPGGQPGHKGHCRKRQEPTQIVKLDPPEEIVSDPDFKKTGQVKAKQLVSIKMELNVTEYIADVYRNSKTGEIAHAAFPDGVVDDVNYDGSIKSFLFLLNTDCCASIDKCSRFLSELTDGKLKISKGMINNLCRELSRKTEEERKAMFARLMSATVLHSDCTNARVNGKSAYVYVNAAPGEPPLYFAREHKGYAGIKGTVVEFFMGIIVHDHEIAYYKYGSAHQECLAHVLRYLKGSVENEPQRHWNKEMHELIREMIHYRNCILTGDIDYDEAKVSEYEKRYSEILKKADEEYENIPPGTYYRDGFNLFKRMKKYQESHLLFLHNPLVPTTNNESERDLRRFKRKQAQAVSYRSFESIECYCNSMSMLYSVRHDESANLFDTITGYYNRSLPDSK